MICARLLDTVTCRFSAGSWYQVSMHLWAAGERKRWWSRHLRGVLRGHGQSIRHCWLRALWGGTLKKERLPLSFASPLSLSTGGRKRVILTRPGEKPEKTTESNEKRVFHNFETTYSSSSHPSQTWSCQCVSIVYLQVTRIQSLSGTISTVTFGDFGWLWVMMKRLQRWFPWNPLHLWVSLLAMGFTH